MHERSKYVRFDPEEGRRFYECPGCGARSFAPSDIAALSCLICGRSAADIEAELAAVIAASESAAA
jgi:transcription elongation factor Elf1